jgi:hypothetical protein
MHRRVPRIALVALAPLVLAGSGLAATRAGSTLKATLTPIAPVRSATGSFSATVANGGGMAFMTWKLRTFRLTSASSSALIYLPTRRQPSLVLCRPCASQAHGVAALSPALAKRLAGGTARVVVTTVKHRSGELRGRIR